MKWLQILLLAFTISACEQRARESNNEAAAYNQENAGTSSQSEFENLRRLCSIGLLQLRDDTEVIQGTWLLQAQEAQRSSEGEISCPIMQAGSEGRVTRVLMVREAPLVSGQTQRHWISLADSQGAELTRQGGQDSVDNIEAARVAAEAARLSAEAEAEAARQARLELQRRTPHWRSETWRSEMTDFQNQSIQTTGTSVVARYQRTYRPALTIRCMENTTSVHIDHGGFVTTQNIRVELRIDDGPVTSHRMNMSTNYEAFGLWRGNQAIPFLQSLINNGPRRLTVRYTPHGESAVTTSFDISGIGERIRPVREACGW
jgi:type VI secretion system protein VasI